MQIDPISAVSQRAAARALEQLREEYQRMAIRILDNANYLKELGQGVAPSAAESEKTKAMFDQFARRTHSHR